MTIEETMEHVKDTNFLVFKDNVREVQEMMTKKSFFSICEVQRCAEYLGRCISSEDLRLMHQLHCKQWGDMSPELRDELKRRVMAILATPRFTLELPSTDAELVKRLTLKEKLFR